LTTKFDERPHSSRYIIHTQGNSVFHPSGSRGKFQPVCIARITAGRVYPCRLAGNTVWSHTAGGTP